MSGPTKILPFLACLLAAACSSGTDEPEPPTTDDTNKALLNAAQQPLEQARQVEKQLQEADEARQKKLDEMTGQ